MPPRNAPPAGPPTDAPVFSVARLNREARRLLEDHFAGIWVSGEISRFTHHSSGHMYFDLKDADASVSCAMFRNSQRSLRFKPGGGQQVLLRGKISIYEANGRYQIIVDHMEEAGEGLLRRQFEELKARLNAEGLFADEHKQALPEMPMRIGIITSPTGAAIRDILNILQRRYPVADVILYPVRVQGEGAKEEIAASLQLANERNECDVLILGRGGGSLEDLWAFNEEIVARAIFASAIPVVSGVGHEIDFTIADLVADLRAPTPSGAAELITPEQQDLKRELTDAERRALLALRQQLAMLTTAQRNLDGRLQRVHPGAVLIQLQQRIDDLSGTLVRLTRRRLETDRAGTIELTRRLTQVTPDGTISILTAERDRLHRQLTLAMRNRVQRSRQALHGLAGNLNAVSPLATLDRGYAILRPAGKPTILRSATQVKSGDAVRAQLADGHVDAVVTHTEKTPRKD
ncbi:MAG: exodeoxyribonuclease VII large subunit [Gammaproteobacteria bacterium]|nr:exodeoxyribonuclease VII large subunit [Gammaproteobacteria bacterium]